MALLACALFAFSGLAALAQKTPASATADDLKRVEAARDAALARLKQLEASATKIDRDAAAIDTDLISAAADSRRREEAATAAEIRLAVLAGETDAARQQLLGDRQSLEDVLAALMALGERRPPALLTAPSDSDRAVRAAIVMSDAAPQLSARAKVLSDRIAHLDRLAADTRAEKDRLAAAEQALAARQAEIEALAGEKRLSRTSLAAETSRLRAESERLANEAEGLRDLLAGLEKAAPTRPSRKPQTVSATKPVTTNPAAAAPTFGKGRVPPVLGSRLHRFGENIDGDRAMGVTYAARAGAQVFAPRDARVEYAGVFRSYGQMLILDVGDGYLVVMSGLEALYPESGQWVLAGEPVGRMAGRTSRPELYFEVRKGGQPVDPEGWLKSGA